MVAETSKSKRPAKNKKSATDPGDIELLKSEIASVASSLGLSSSLPSSGFNDSDFRKKGPLKPQNPSDNQRPQKPKKDANAKEKKETFAGKKETFTGDDKRKPKPKAAVLSIDENKIGNSVKGVDKFRNLPKLPLVKASALAVWYEDAQQLEAKVIGLGKKLEVKNAEEWKAFVEKKRELGERLMVQYSQDYESSRGQSGDIKMLVATQRSGTAADKVSAFSVMVGDNPIANLRSLDGLVGLVTSKVGKRHALTGFEVLKELFVSSLLPDRKLKTLLQRPLNHLSETKDGYSLLLFWYWEECLKQRYERFIFALEEASRDMLPVLKDKALKTMSQLLKSKSEQERRLLSALVNKLGDPQNKGASNAEYHLSNLLMEHPNMQAVVIDEVDSFLFRPHLGLRAKYHAVNFLSQFRLSHRGDGPKVAKRLIDVYFALFKVLITEAGAGQDTDKNSKKDHKKVAGAKGKTNESESHVELDSRILSALLTGVNRAFPFVSSTEADDIVEVQTPLLFQLVHSKNFNIEIQALMLLDKISSKNQIVSDRFYRALYSKLLLPAAMHSSKAEMFIGLLLRAMKNDVNLKRVSAFSKRLLQVALQVPPQYACGYLFLLSELLKARPPLWNMVQQSESVDDELEHFEDIKEESDKEDAESDKQKNNAESRADAKTESVSSEDEDDAPVPASCNDDDSDDDVTDEDVELFVKNVPDNDEETNDGSRKTRGDSTRHLLPGGYDPRHREPSYSNADCVCWWELMVLASHVHPSVATMARTLLSGTNIVYNGNPLNDLSLTAFLEKLMEKKPKASTWHGGSQIEPAKKLEMNNHLIGAELLSLAETDVPPEDLVFHKFYLNKMNTTRKQKKKKKKGKEEEDAEELFEVDGGDESDNEEIDNILDEAEIASDKEDGEYDYDDLDRIGFDSDDDLVGDASDVELDGPSEGEDFDFDAADDDDDVDGANDADDNDNGDDDVAIGDVDDGSDDDANEETFLKAKKRKLGKRTGVSPFASLEDYKHLMQDDDAAAEDSPKLKKSRKEKSKSQKKQQKKKKSTE